MHLSFLRHHKCDWPGCAAEWDDYSGVTKYCPEHREAAAARYRQSERYRRQRRILARRVRAKDRSVIA